MSRTGYSQWFRPSSGSAPTTFDGAVINDYNTGQSDVTLGPTGIDDMDMEHTVIDTASYVDTSELGQKTLKIPTGGHGNFRVNAFARSRSQGTAPTSGHVGFYVEQHTGGGGANISGVLATWEIAYPNYLASGANDVQFNASVDTYMDDGDWLEFYVQNSTNQNIVIFHYNSANAPPSAVLSIMRLDSASAP